MRVHTLPFAATFGETDCVLTQYTLVSLVDVVQPVYVFVSLPGERDREGEAVISLANALSEISLKLKKKNLIEKLLYLLYL